MLEAVRLPDFGAVPMSIGTVESTRIDVRKFGARGDGVADDRLAIQRALDAAKARGGGIVHIPAGVYDISYPLIVWDNTTVVGDGRATLIRNSNTETDPSSPQSTTYSRCCFYFGGYAREDSEDDITWVGIEDVDAADASYAVGGLNDTLPTAILGYNRVVCRTHADAAEFEVGDVVNVRNNVGVNYGATNRTDWQYNVLNRVASVDPDTGIIELEYPIEESLEDPYIGRMPRETDANFRITSGLYGQWPDDAQMIRRVIQNAAIMNLAVWSEENYWTQRGAFFNCLWFNIWVEKSQGLIAGNCFSHSLIDGVRGSFSIRAIEIATGASDTVIRNVDGWFRSDGEAATWRTKSGGHEMMAIHGGSRRMHVSDVRIDARGYQGSHALRVDGRRNIIRNINVYAPHLEGSALALSATHPSNINTDNVIEGCTFQVGVFPSRFYSDQDYDTDPPTYTGPEVSYNGLDRYVAINPGKGRLERLDIRNNHFVGAVASEAVRIDAPQSSPIADVAAADVYFTTGDYVAGVFVPDSECVRFAPGDRVRLTGEEVGAGTAYRSAEVEVDYVDVATSRVYVVGTIGIDGESMVATPLDRPTGCFVHGNYFAEGGSNGHFYNLADDGDIDIRGNTSKMTGRALKPTGAAYVGTSTTGATWRRRKIWLFPAGSLRSGDVLRFSASGSCAGTLGTKKLRYFVGTTAGGSTASGGALVREVETTSGFVESFVADLVLHIESPTSQRSTQTVRLHGAYPAVGTKNTTVDLSTTDLRVSIDSYCSDVTGADSVAIYDVQCQLERPGEIP